MSFLISLFCLLFFPVLLPKCPLLFFAPHLIYGLYKKELLPALWNALLCGVVVDLFSQTAHFGFSALNYVAALLILRTLKHNFFEDRLATLPLMTALFSMLNTLFMLFEQKGLFSLRFLVTDLFEMALVDALYAFIWQLFFHFRKKIGRMRM